MRRMRAIVVAGLLGGLTAWGAGCAQRRATPEAAWTPNSAAQFATQNRSTRMTLVHDEDRDLLSVSDPRPEAGRGWSRLTWIVSIPRVAALDRDMPLDGAQAWGWAMEEIPGLPTHVTPVRGTVRVTQRTGEQVSAVVDLYFDSRAAAAGEVAPPRVTFTRRVEALRRVPAAAEFREIGTRGGGESQSAR
ncbi:MAG: hypothetical protein IBJ11_09090 [Phycisphaerales bacterium]|nr:hypothetical protein [Phycisphaerales bacterium]